MCEKRRNSSQTYQPCRRAHVVVTAKTSFTFRKRAMTVCMLSGKSKSVRGAAAMVVVVVMVLPPPLLLVLLPEVFLAALVFLEGAMVRCSCAMLAASVCLCDLCGGVGGKKQ